MQRCYTLNETSPWPSWLEESMMGWNQNERRSGDDVVNVPSVIAQVVKMKGQPLAVGSVEPKDMPICMHQHKKPLSHFKGLFT